MISERPSPLRKCRKQARYRYYPLDLSLGFISLGTQGHGCSKQRIFSSTLLLCLNFCLHCQVKDPTFFFLIKHHFLTNNNVLRYKHDKRPVETVTIMGEAHAYSELFSEEQKMKNSNLLQSSLAHFGHPRGKKARVQFCGRIHTGN